MTRQSTLPTSSQLAPMIGSDCNWALPNRPRRRPVLAKLVDRFALGADIMLRLTISCAILVGLAATAQADDDKIDRNRPPEFKVLDHYLGVWNVEILSKGPVAKGSVK